MFEALKSKLRVEWRIKENPAPLSIDMGDERWNQHLEKLAQSRIDNGDLWIWGIVTVMVTFGPFQEVKNIEVQCPDGEEYFKNRILPPVVETMVGSITTRARDIAQDAAILSAVISQEGWNSK